ncbi:MAG TPA: family 10 glycosylhydrolase, partial [Luteitalea sp.]|nr:family 10 glycosylhydrolase [Luteitalea sp.]
GLRPRPAAARPASSEVRGLWVTRSWMTSPAQVAQVVQDAQRHGFNAVFVQVRGRGDAFYKGGPDPRAVLLARQPTGFDPLADLVGRAAAAGIQVHAWLNVNLVAGSTAIPSDPKHVLVEHPEWLMVPRSLAPDLLRLSPRDPKYVARLATWSHRHNTTIEGVFTSPIPEEAHDRADALIDHLTSRYALDGLHLDYIRYPSPEFDCSRGALDAFRAALSPELTTQELAALDARATRDPLTFVTDYASRWTAFRRERLTTLVRRIRERATANRPAIQLTAAVWPDPEDARQRKLQDWSTWLSTGLLDAVCPMMYVQNGGTFERQLQALSQQRPGGVWPGIGAFKIDAGEAARRVDVARTMGFSGVMLYSYDSMTGGVGRASTYMSTLQRRAFGNATSSHTGAAR